MCVLPIDEFYSERHVSHLTLLFDKRPLQYPTPFRDPATVIDQTVASLKRLIEGGMTPGTSLLVRGES